MFTARTIVNAGNIQLNIHNQKQFRPRHIGAAFNAELVEVL